jgi:ParB-like chromosome segregation protein Spo0J
MVSAEQGAPIPAVRGRTLARPLLCAKEISMKIEYWEIAKVKPYDKNPRRNDKAVEAVAKSIREFGFRQPIVVDAAGVIVVGHTRYKAALKLGLKTVPVHVAADLTPAQARAYRLADNRTAETAEWDVELLPIELGELRDDGFDLKLLGFTDKELAERLKEFDTELDDGQADADEAAETIRCPKCGHEFPLE